MNKVTSTGMNLVSKNIKESIKENNNTQENFLAKRKKTEVYVKDDLIEGEYEDKDNENDKKL